MKGIFFIQALVLATVFGVVRQCVAQANSPSIDRGPVRSEPVQNPNSVRSSIPQYSNSENGLESLMRDMVALQQRNDSVALASYFQSLVLPSAERWFSSEFGDSDCEASDLGPNGCLGPRMAWYYTVTANKLPDSFALTLADLAHENLVNFEAVNQTEQCAGPMRIVPSQKLIGEFTTAPVLLSPWSKLVRQKEPVYVLWAFNESKETTLNFFVYSLGAFRYIGMPRPAPADDYRQKKYSAGSFPPASPSILTNEQLKMKSVLIEPAKVSKTVVVRVVVDREGKPSEVSYIRGVELFKDAAIERTRKRRFERPGFGPNGLHPNVFCLAVTQH